MSDLNDKELFDNAIADTPAETPTEVVETPQNVDEPATEGRVRDPETGRFAKAETPAPVTEQPQAEPQAEPQVQPDNAAHVPSWRLREVNEAREAAERRFNDEVAARQNLERQLAEIRQQNQPKAEPIDIFTDPDAAFKQRLSPVEEQMRTMQANFNLRASKAEAIAGHGKAAVDEMEKALGEAMRSGQPDMQTLSVQMRNSDDPVGVAMNWYQRDKLVKETGGDLSAFKTNLLKDPTFLAQALEAAKAQASGQSPGTRPNTVVQLPPSINRATSAASPHDEAGDLSDKSLYANAIR